MLCEKNAEGRFLKLIQLLSETIFFQIDNEFHTLGDNVLKSLD